MKSLFHVSDLPGITHFEPRTPPTPHPALSTPVVWAVETRCLPNYLLPRDCPRVTFHNGPGTTPADLAAHLPGPARHVVAIESAWLDRVASTRLWLYHFDPKSFYLLDATAGYHVSEHAVFPLKSEPIDGLPALLAELEVELRVLPELWSLRDAIQGSTLAYSFIRMRNAAPRQIAQNSFLTKP